jgi:Uma2 family endonuclease
MSQIPHPAVHPAEDSVRVGETGLHHLVSLDLVEQLAELFHDRKDVAIEGNRLVYWDPTETVNPDVFVCLGRPRATRDVWKTWEEDGKFADVVFEVTSKRTQRRDIGDKKAAYEMQGVREYVVFDPRREWVREGLRVWRLVNGEYRRLDVVDGRVWLASLQVTVETDGQLLRLVRWDGVPMHHAEERRERLLRSEAEKNALEARNRAVEAERDTLAAEKSAVAAERDALAAEVAALRARLARSG